MRLQGARSPRVATYSRSAASKWAGSPRPGMPWSSREMARRVEEVQLASLAHQRAFQAGSMHGNAWQAPDSWRHAIIMFIKMPRPSSLQVPNGAAGHYLLGRVSRLQGRIADAKDHFVRALNLDPLLWSAYEDLCAIGEHACVHVCMIYWGRKETDVAAT